jgi:hypothetical protein
MKNKYHTPKFRFTNEYEYVDVLARTSGARNDVGEPVVAWVTTANVKCMMASPNRITAESLALFTQGLVEISNYWAMFEVGVTINARDKVIDENNRVYNVLETKNYRTHQEALLKTLEK